MFTLETKLENALEIEKAGNNPLRSGSPALYGCARVAAAQQWPKAEAPVRDGGFVEKPPCF